uniref:ATP-dependent RNA helicase n=1 Tax=Octactis speculum TaxID=3111310 RepID=A0A7S2ALE1_9STRA|mmetsp:Transcript_12009/g.15812  ORF Transcript_12009/g.15812 Transcript_12009/m.15812 type:complete len:477 (+) Transcript_12009:38-1468(+)
MGIKRPTPVQRICIPAALKGRDVVGLAETGSGKTAAFALPILQKLSENPYGVFALVLTPTRELAIQIGEQMNALGAPLHVRLTTLIGGMDMTTQAVELQQRPHIVVATLGRLVQHIINDPAVKSLFRRLSFLVLDEADRMLSLGFDDDLKTVIAATQESVDRQTLLFSATTTDTITEIQSIAAKKTCPPCVFDLTVERALPATLTLEYLFMSAQVKMCYLIETLRVMVELDLQDNNNNNSQGGGKKGRRHPSNRKADMRKLKQEALDKMEALAPGEDGDSPEGDTGGRAKSAIIFTGSCKRCQEVTMVLLELGIDCVCIHSLLSQRRRTAALGKFKTHTTKILIATDVASRGLDIPEVDLVINFDLPRAPSDFVHRVGRTARRGRRGNAISLVTQHDVELVHAIEEFTGFKLSLRKGITDDNVLPLLNPVAKAMRVARQKLVEIGFDEKVQNLKARANRQRKAKASREDNSCEEKS